MEPTLVCQQPVALTDAPALNAGAVLRSAVAKEEALVLGKPADVDGVQRWEVTRGSTHKLKIAPCAVAKSWRTLSRLYRSRLFASKYSFCSSFKLVEEPRILHKSTQNGNRLVAIWIRNF